MKNNKSKKTTEQQLEVFSDKQAIRDLYMGKTGRYEQNNEEILNCKDYIESLAKVEKIKAKLIPSLNDKQKLLIFKLVELEEMQTIEDSVSAYEDGFKTGVCLGFESGKSIE